MQNKITDALGGETYYGYDGNRNTILTIDARDNATYMVYDDSNRLTSEKDALLRETVHGYDDNGNRDRTTNLLGHTAYFVYDGASRLKGTHEYLGAVKLETAHTLDPNGNITKTVNPRGYATYFTYDVRNLVTQRKNALLYTTDHTCDENGNRIKTLNAISHGTYFYYDAVDRQKGSYEYVGAQKLETYFEFDEVGNTKKIVDARLNTTTMAYTALNQLESQTDPLGETAYYVYDEEGNMARSTDAEEITAYFMHDALNRRTKTSYSGGDYAYFGYDKVHNLTSMEDSTWGTTYLDYDAANQVTRRETPDGRVIEWEYNDNAFVTKIAYAAGGGAYYTYDDLDRMTAVEAPSGTTATYEYDANGNVTKKVLGDGSYAYFAYDAVDQLTSIRSAKSDGTPITYFEFERNPVSDIVTAVLETDDVVYYTYDEARRLTDETWEDSGGTTLYGFAYDYDLAGNREYAEVTIGGTTEVYYTYDDANALTRRHTLATVAGRTAGWAYYVYDRNGSLTSFKDEAGATTAFAYKDNGLVGSVAPAAGDSVYFYYDGRSTRYAMTEGADTTYFLWDEDRLRILELRTGAETRRLTHGHAPVDGVGTIVEEEIVGGEKYYHHLDHRGTTCKITDSAGDVVWNGRVNAFGEDLASSGTSPSIFWYQGEAWYRIVIDGRTYYVSPTRIYDPEDGRFLQRDPKGYVDGYNLYEAFGGNPVRRVDPRGTDDIVARNPVSGFIGYYASRAAVPKGYEVLDASTINRVIRAHGTLPYDIYVDTQGRHWKATGRWYMEKTSPNAATVTRKVILLDPPIRTVPTTCPDSCCPITGTRASAESEPCHSPASSRELGPIMNPPTLTEEPDLRALPSKVVAERLTPDPNVRYAVETEHELNALARAGKTCGPDVTDALNAALTKIASDFRSALTSPEQRVDHCNGLLTLATAWMAWDMDELHNYDKRIKVNPKFAMCGQGRGCGRTVLVDGGCHSAADVNYAMWGLMGQLCGWDKEFEKKVASTHKRISYFYKLKRWSEALQPTFAWIEAGHDFGETGKLTKVPVSGHRKTCRPCGGKLSHIASNWIPESESWNRLKWGIKGLF